MTALAQMNEQAFRNEALRVMGGWRRDDVFSWTVSYLLATLRHHGVEGEKLRQRAVEAGL